MWDDGEDEWTPREEPLEIVALREELLAALDSLAREIPGDPWVFGQRIRYLVEAGRLADAAALAELCGLPRRWQCDAYLGYVRHHQQNIRGAERAFRRALDAMPGRIRADWTDPEPVLGPRSATAGSPAMRTRTRPWTASGCWPTPSSWRRATTGGPAT